MEYFIPKQITLKEAGQRLTWRFSQGKSFLPNQSDIDSLNMILRTINQNQEKAVQEDRLFAKLYLVLMNDFVIHYGNIDLAHKQINRLLSTQSVEQRCQLLCNTLNQVETANFTIDKGIKGVVDANTVLEKDSNIAADVITYANINKGELMETLEMWDIDSVIANANASISQVLNNYKNLP